jgi:hypothetical protein
MPAIAFTSPPHARATALRQHFFRSAKVVLPLLPALIGTLTFKIESIECAN